MTRMPLLHELASSFGRVNAAQQLNLLPTLAVMRREEVATDTIINLVDNKGLEVGNLKAHSLVLVAASTLLSELLESSWSPGTGYSVTLAGRDLVEAEGLLEGVYRGEEGKVARLNSWIKGEEGFEEKATAFKNLEVEILGGIKDENIGTKGEREIENQGEAVGMERANQRIQPPNQCKLLCPVVACDLVFVSREGMRHHLKAEHSKSNENHGNIKTITMIDGKLDFKVDKLQDLSDMFLPVKNQEEVVKIAQRQNDDTSKDSVQISPKENLLCPELGCGSEYTHRQSLMAHIKNVHQRSLKDNVGRENLLCPELGCQSDYTLRQSLMAHIKIVHLKSLQENEEQQCNVCEEVLESTDELDAHVKSLHPKVPRLNCPYPECSDDFVKMAILLKHLKIDHVRLIECKVCGIFYKDVHNLKKHNSRKHSSQKFKCDQCEYRTSVMCNLRQHKDSKHDPTRYTCEFCGNDFSTASNLNVHMIQKHGKEHKGQELMCSECDYKTISQPAKMKVHIEKKHNSVRFTCLHCELFFVNSQTLDSHMSSEHEAEQMKEKMVVKSSERKRKEREATKEYPCTDCVQIFRKRGGLRNHKISQHQKLSFSCPEEGCDYKTKHKPNVKQHQDRKHLRLFKYCDLCDFRSISKKYIVSHKINKHKVTPIVFSCNKCETKHSSRDKMRKHMLSMH